MPRREVTIILTKVHYITQCHSVFTRESSYCFQRILAITILAVRSSICHTGGSVKNGAS